jgi:uncharacterized protein YwbE
MLTNVKQGLHGCIITARDGQIGRADEVYFDSVNWHVRYLVVDTDTWLWGRKVLLSPASVEAVRAEDHIITVSLTREQVRNSPDIDTEKPVSLQQQHALHEYYGWPMYWGVGGLGMPGFEPVPYDLDELDKQKRKEQEKDDPNLRSSKDLGGYKIHASDGQIGHVHDIVLNTSNWTVRYIDVDTRNWLPGPDVLLPCEWIENISWEDREITVPFSTEVIKTAPVFDHKGVTRQYEAELFEYYQSAAHSS